MKTAFLVGVIIFSMFLIVPISVYGNGAVPTNATLYINGSSANATSCFIDSMNLTAVDEFGTGATVDLYVNGVNVDSGSPPPESFNYTLDYNDILDDCYADQDLPTTTTGTQGALAIGDRPARVKYGYYKWDLSPLPTNSNVSSAEVCLTMGGGRKCRIKKYSGLFG